jgi:P4 family phage/plasmid primase-like protien
MSIEETIEAVTGVASGSPISDRRNAIGPLALGVDVAGQGGTLVLSKSAYRLLRDWGSDPFDLGSHWASAPGVALVELLPRIPLDERVAFLSGYYSERKEGAHSQLTVEARTPRLTPDGLGPSPAARRIRSLLYGVEQEGGLGVVNEDQLRQVARDIADLCLPLSWMCDELVAGGVESDDALRLAYRLHPHWSGLMRESDLAHAERFCRYFGHDVRFCRGLGWLVWSGRRWQRDSLGEVENRVKGVARTWRADAELVAQLVPHCDSEDAVNAIGNAVVELSEVAHNTESLRTLTAMRKIAESEPGIAVADSSFDVDPLLLNVNNGIIDLRTGDLRPHSGDDYMTMLAPVMYRPGARFSLWEQFLKQVTGGDNELESYLQRALGYSITGLTSEDVLLFVFGPGGSGKSTFVKAISSVLGDYAATADFESLVKRPGAGGIRNDIARLRGRRLVSSIEVDEGKELAQGLVKTITGGDVVAARFLYKEFFEFQPTFTLLLVANDPPELDANDSGMWRRIRALPFDNALPKDEQSPMVRSLLASPELAGPAILNWLVEGCLMWQEEGLGSCRAVDERTRGYREEVDVLGRFLHDVCFVDAGASVRSGDLYRAYSAWARENGELPVFTQNLFGRKLTNRGYPIAKVNDQRIRQGLCLSRWKLAMMLPDEAPAVSLRGTG